MLKILGLPFSAHTRKVIVASHYKGLPFELVPVIPFDPPAGFRKLSPLGKIPVLEDGSFTVPDSSVIGLYLDRAHPGPGLYPADAKAFARALWIEELVDGDLARHVLHGVLFQRVLAPRFLRQQPDEALIERSLKEEIPARFADLEQSLEGDWFAGSFSYADITVTSMLVNFRYAGGQLSSTDYPKLHALFGRALRRDCFTKALEKETPAAEQFGGLDLGVLRELGY